MVIPAHSVSYVTPTRTSPWGTYLAQVERVLPYLGTLAAGWARSPAPSGR